MSLNSGEEEQVENGTNNKVHFVYLCTCGAVSHFVIYVSVLVHGQVTIIFVVSVCLFVCAEFFSAVFDPISIKLGHVMSGSSCVP